MKTLQTICLALLLSTFSSAYASDEWLDIESSKSSPNSKSTAMLYTSIKPLQEGERAVQIMRFSTPTKDWLQIINDGSNVRKYEFIDNEHLLIVSGNFTSDSTGILNMDTRHLEWIGGGVGEIVSWNDNKKLIKLYGKKAYRWDENGEPLGAIWFDLIVNVDGDIIQLLTPARGNGECIPIKEILEWSYEPDEYINIEQPLDDCITVER
jgi:hypothetical protein